MLDFSNVKRQQLENGLVALTDTEVDNDIVALKLHMRGGSLYESDTEAGLASCLMRMLLKGTVRRSAADLALELESKGIRLHTGVGNENGLVSLVCPREVFDEGLDLMLEILTEPSFPEDELGLDVQRTIGKIRARLDHPMSQAVDLFDETYYAQHPYHKPAIGYEQTVGAIGSGRIRDLWGQVLSSGNMVASLVGRVDADSVIRRLQERLRTLPGGDLEPCDGRPPSEETRLEEQRRQTQTAWIIVGWPAPPIGHDDSPTMTLLTTILGGSLDSRLFTELRDKRGLAYEIGAQYRAYAGPSCMMCYMGTSGEQYTVGRQGLIAEVDRLRAGGASSGELERARAYLSGSHRMAMERNSHRASSYGIHELFGLGYDYAATFLDKLAQVEHDDLMRVADTWWRSRTVAAVVPEGQADVAIT